MKEDNGPAAAATCDVSLTSTLIELPTEIRLKIYHYCLNGLALNHDVDEPLTIKAYTSLTNSGPYIQIEKVDILWISLFGVCRKVRHEVMSLFWHLNTFRLRPEVVTCLGSLAGSEVRRLLVEVIHPDRGSSAYAFDQMQVLEAMPLFLGLPSLEEIELCIDAASLRDCIPIDREGFCPQHTKHIRESKVLAELAEGLDENLAGYLHFRIHMSYEAMLRTHDKVVSEFPSLSEIGNNSLNPCDDHDLGFCENITCRLLHAIEEMCQGYCARPTMRLYFFEEAITNWNEHASIWVPDEAQLPLVVNVMDMRDAALGRSYELQVDEDLFFVRFLNNTSANTQVSLN